MFLLTSTATTVALLLMASKLLQCLYRVTVHPLAKFPGPVLAKLTYYYEFYFDGIKKGQYNAEIRRLHEIYGSLEKLESLFSILISDAGPIVRVNPDELHCNDPQFLNQVFAGPGRRRDKWNYYNNGSASYV
jgi:hypothetical protein